MKLKKLLAAVLATALCATMLAVPAFAKGSPDQTDLVGISGISVSSSLDNLQEGLQQKVSDAIAGYSVPHYDQDTFANFRNEFVLPTIEKAVNDSALWASLDKSSIVTPSYEECLKKQIFEHKGDYVHWAICTISYVSVAPIPSDPSEPAANTSSAKTFAEVMAPYMAPADIAFAEAWMQYNATHDPDLTKEEYWSRVYWTVAPAAPAATAAAPGANAAVPGNPNRYTPEQQLRANNDFAKAVAAYQAEIAAQNAAYTAAVRGNS